MVNVIEMMHLCRLCLVKDQVNIPIFEEQGDIRQIFLKITACLPVKVSREDNLPKKICDGCLYKLELLYQFWNTTANAEKQLLTWLSQAGLEVNTQTTDKAMEIVAKSHAHPHSDDSEPIVLKQEAIDPSEVRTENSASAALSSEAQSYILQQQQLPYESFSFEQGGFTEEQVGDATTSAIITETVEEPAPKRRKRAAALKALPIITQESDEDADDVEPIAITKTEEDSEEETESVEPTNFVGIPTSTSDNEQPGPSGVGKSSTEAP